MKRKNDVRSNNSWKDAAIAVSLALLVISGLATAYYTNSAKGIIAEKVAGIKEAQTPARLEVVEISDNSCKDCFNISMVSSEIAKLGANITKVQTLEFSQSEAKDIISEYSIQRIPAVIISGEINKSGIGSILENSGGMAEGNSIVFESIPPYVDASTGQVKGLVTLVLLNDTSCSTCYDVTLHRQILKFGVVVKSEEAYDVSSAQGKEYISKYNITKVPTMLLSPDAGVYPALKQVWPQVGTKEKDGWLVFRAVEVMGNYTTLAR